MAEGTAYALSDLLLFSPRVYYRLFELHNRGAVACPAPDLRPRPCRPVAAGCGRYGRAHRLLPAVLGVLWLWVAWAFFWERYATINWAAAYVAPLFALQGLALLCVAGTRHGLERELEQLGPRSGGAGSGSLCPRRLSLARTAHGPVLAGRGDVRYRARSDRGRHPRRPGHDPGPLPMASVPDPGLVVRHFRADPVDHGRGRLLRRTAGRCARHPHRGCSASVACCRSETALSDHAPRPRSRPRTRRPGRDTSTSELAGRTSPK